MVKRNSEIQRMNKEMFDEIKRKQKELEQTTKMKVSFPQASQSFFNEFKELKAKITKKGEIKF
ncbi:MAG: hypothetical protein IMZ60_00165 [Actinobacteria bacterium]|nr:hypothetical protein [Actinomycetota bacterium]